jgi:hypothetical protein
VTFLASSDSDYVTGQESTSMAVSKWATNIEGKKAGLDQVLQRLLKAPEPFASVAPPGERESRRH